MITEVNNKQKAVKNIKQRADGNNGNNRTITDESLHIKKTVKKNMKEELNKN